MSVPKFEIQNPVLIKIGSLADKNNFEIYAVGGFVRDKLLNKNVNDIDILVVGDGVGFAKIVEKNFNKSNLVVFEKFGTCMLQLDEFKLEFVGARKESYSKDSRKPLVQSGTLDDDLHRRDFTINAMSISLNKKNWCKFTDLFNGESDLKNKIIKTPLDPFKTFDDDPLRMMRAVRFASQIKGQIEQKTFDAIFQMKERLSIVSQERITHEFLKILESENPSIGLKLMFETGLMRIVFPEVEDLAGAEQREDYHHKDVFLHTCIVVDNISAMTKNLYLRFVALVHDIAKPKTKQFKDGIGWTFYGHEELGAKMMKSIFKRMKLPTSKLNYVEKLVRFHLRPMALVDEVVTDSALRRLLVDAGEDIDDLITLCRADITSKNPNLVKQYLENYNVVCTKLKEVEEKDRMRSFQSPVRGDEIMKLLNLEPSKLVGVIKTEIEEAILEGRIENTHESALKFLMDNKSRLLAG
ncbi:MAG: HD domain-containing protein [Bacteroidetes bacterium]|nr:HD domain-containing protein [Bacteroidota bacterium]